MASSHSKNQYQERVRSQRLSCGQQLDALYVRFENPVRSMNWASFAVSRCPPKRASPDKVRGDNIDQLITSAPPPHEKSLFS
jgi:hypothetical protein